MVLTREAELQRVEARHERVRASQAQAATTFRPLEVYIAAACIYLAINLCFAALGRYLEHRMAV